jgi:hypothetical protein
MIRPNRHETVDRQQVLYYRAQTGGVPHQVDVTVPSVGEGAQCLQQHLMDGLYNESDAGHAVRRVAQFIVLQIQVLQAIGCAVRGEMQ